MGSLIRKMPLKHMNYENTAKFAEQTVSRTTIGSILRSNYYNQVVIPLFQRPYCWSVEQLEGWMTSVREGAEVLDESQEILQQLDDIDETNDDDFHSVGIGRFKKSCDSLICVDGQQRLTTSSLLIASLRDILKEVAKNEKDVSDQCQYFINVAENFLFNDISVAHGKSRSKEVEKTPLYLRLLPSELDRVPYQLALFGSNASEQFENVESSCISRTKQFFLHYLHDLVSNEENSEKIKSLSRIFRSAVLWMRMMKIEVESDINLGQWFLWIQEKALFGFAALLYNDTPGVNFNAADLVKNLLMSVFIEKSMEEQECLYACQWVHPIQKIIGHDALDNFLHRFLEQKDFKEILTDDDYSQRHIGNYEKQILTLINSMKEDDSSGEEEEKIGTKNFFGIRLYSRFQSYYDFHLQKESDIEQVHLTLLSQLQDFVKDSV